MFQVQAEMAEDGDKVSISQLSRWFGVPRRTLYYKPTKQAPKVNPVLAKKVKALIDELPFAGYRTLAFLLGLNRNTVQRINQIKGWQCRKRQIGFRSQRALGNRPNPCLVRTRRSLENAVSGDRLSHARNFGLAPQSSRQRQDRRGNP